VKNYSKVSNLKELLNDISNGVLTVLPKKKFKGLKIKSLLSRGQAAGICFQVRFKKDEMAIPLLSHSVV
jgi:hypothetical protein